MIRVAVVDRQPTVRAGLDAILAGQPDLVAVGGAGHARELWPLLRRVRPDLVVLDGPTLGEALALCLQLKAGLVRPHVVLFASAVRTGAIVPATLAGADGIVDKAADVRELLHVIRTVAGGERALPRITPRLQADAAQRLAPRTARSSPCAWRAHPRRTSRPPFGSRRTSSTRASPRSSPLSPAPRDASPAGILRPWPPFSADALRRRSSVDGGPAVRVAAVCTPPRRREAPCARRRRPGTVGR